MSIVKLFSVRCDFCQRERESLGRLVANSYGITKGDGTASCRKEAKEFDGWKSVRREVRGRTVRIDLCPQCKDEKGFVPWFMEG